MTRVMKMHNSLLRQRLLLRNARTLSLSDDVLGIFIFTYSRDVKFYLPHSKRIVSLTGFAYQIISPYMYIFLKWKDM